MTYEEACRELDRACKDWEVTSANYKLEKLAHETSCKEHHKNVQSSLDNVFKKLTNTVITVEAVPILDSRKYKLRVFILCENGEIHHGDCYTWGVKESQKVSEKEFLSTLFQGIRHVLGSALTSETIISTSELLKLASYISITEMDMKQSKIYDSLQKNADELLKESDQMDLLRTEHDSWVEAIWKKALIASKAWFGEGLCAPGMKAVVYDYNTKRYFTGTIFFSEEDNDLVVGTASGKKITALYSPAVYGAATWLANNEKYKTIMQTIEAPAIANIRL